ncbi:hypothetical protein ACFFIX_16525 [Metabacillus herbersteinensis]|uniref:Uncharacterized protein n=1 Tax=Metabacillus herbersteinensis TaxID=283816 RepID=A0ABV6GH70_9BACI
MNQEEIVVTISKDVGDMLRKGNQEQSIEKAILNSIALFISI